METSVDGAAVSALWVLSVLLPLFGSGSFAVTVALLSNVSAAVMVAVTVMVVFAPTPRLAIVHGKIGRASWRERVMVRLVVVAVTWTLGAVDGPGLATTSV